MTVNYTTNLALGQPVTGTESGTWGDDVNNSVTSYLDIAIAGGLAITITTTDVTLSLTQGTSSATNIGSTTAQYAILNISGAMTAARNLILPSSSRQYVINNNTTGGFALTVKGAATTGVTMVNGESSHIYWNGSDYAKLSNAPGGAGTFTTLSASSTVSGTGFSTYLASPPAIGGTAAAAGSFTTLSASSTVSGTGFSTYLASPPAIGGTAANTGAFTSITSTSASGILTRAAATQDGVELIGRAGGTTSLKVTFTPTTLTASRTLTLPDNSGTLLTTGAVVTVAQGGTGQTTYTDGQLLIGNTTGNTLTKATLTAGTGVTITNGAGAITINATGTGGTVTSVAQSFTGGLISVAGSPITTSGTLALTVAGTSGGVPYFSSASTWASSAALAANALMIGGGAGAAPATTTTGTGVLTALGTAVGTAGAFVVNGGALGTPSSGTLTNATGLPLTSGVTGTLPVANGGTGLITTPANGALDIGNGTGFTRTTLTAGTGVSITNAAGSITINATGTGGTVTSVAQSFTGGLISVAGSPITTSGTLALTVAGTSGGVPYFSSASTWASSAALAASALMIGGGAGAAPSTTTTGTGVLTALGIAVGTAGAFVVNGGALGTPSSGTVTNLTGTASININGTVGATTPAAGTFTSLTDSGNLTFTGTSNRITGDFSNATVANRVTFQTSTSNSNTSIGVIPNGTATGTNFSAFAGTDSSNSSFMRIRTDGTLSYLEADRNGTGTYLPMTFYTGGSERMRLDTSGNVGIGTSSPSYKLDVSGVIRGTGNVISGDGSAFVFGTGVTSYVSGSSTSNVIDLYTNSTQRMRIDSSGNVGIGTSSPGYKLDVQSATASTQLKSTTGTNYVAHFLNNTGGFTYLGVESSAGGSLFTGTAAYEAVFGTVNSYPVGFATGGAERMRIDTSGNLLVGTTTAGAKLTVAGNAATPTSAVTFSATAMTLNCALSNVFTTTFTANVTTAPTLSNPADGQTLNWFITQDATGTRTMTWPTSFKWPGGTAGVLSTAANSVDLLVATYRSATGFWYATLSKGFA